MVPERRSTQEFRLDTIDKLDVINLGNNSSKNYTALIFGDSEIAFHREGKDAVFCPFR